MKNWLTEIYNYLKPSPTKNQGTACPDVSVSSPDNPKEDAQIRYEAHQHLTPEYFLVIAEMRNLLDSATKKTVFYALSTGLSVADVAAHLEMTHHEVNAIYWQTIEDIQRQSGFIRRYLDNEIQKEALENKQPAEKEMTSEIPSAEQIALLSRPIGECISVGARILNTFKSLEIKTVEDLLRYAAVHGLKTLKYQRNFSEGSLCTLTNELIQKGILKADGTSELYKYITKPNPEAQTADAPPINN